MQQRIVFHIGYPKTATSWLQRGVYPELDGVNYLGRSYYKKSRSEKLFNRVLHRLPWKPAPVTKLIKSPTPHSQWIQEIGYAADGEYKRDDIRTTLDAVMQGDKLNVISHEGLCKPYLEEMVANRIQDLADGLDVKIVISIRRQPELILSRYTHDFHIKRWQYKLADVLDREGSLFCNYPACQHGRIRCLCEQRGGKVIFLEHYNFLRVYNMYAERFGADRVFVLVFERLFEDGAQEFQRYFNFLGLNPGSAEIQRFMTRPPQGKNSQADKEVVRKFNGPALNELLDEFRSYYSSSNAELSRSSNLQLEDYGYVTGERTTNGQ